MTSTATVEMTGKTATTSVKDSHSTFVRFVYLAPVKSGGFFLGRQRVMALHAFHAAAASDLSFLLHACSGESSQRSLGEITQPEAEQPEAAEISRDTQH